MTNERSSIYTVMKNEIDERFPAQKNNENFVRENKTNWNLRKGLVALSIGVGIFGNISGCNSYLASYIYPRQEVIIKKVKNDLPLRNYHPNSPRWGLLS